jgi:hypothetical protein
MRLRLPTVKAKLDRAEHHIDTLDEAIERFIEANPHRTVTQFQQQMSRSSKGAGIVGRVELASPPQGLSLIIGDAIQNMRTALDYLAWELVFANGGVPTKSTQFPINDDRLTQRGVSRSLVVAGGVSEAASALIDDLQPYNRVDDPTEDPLAVIHDLSNVDKHRSVLLMTAMFDQGVTYISIRDGEELFMQPLGGTVENHAVVAQFPYVPQLWSDPSEVDVKVEGSMFVALNEPRAAAEGEVSKALRGLLAYLRDDVLPAFEKLGHLRR